LTLFVGLGIFSLLTDKSHAKLTPIIQSDQSELVLRITSACVYAEEHMPTPSGSKNISHDMLDKVMKESLKDLDLNLVQDPANVTFAARKTILTHMLDMPVDSAIAALKQTGNPDAAKLAKDFSIIYGKPGSADLKTALAVELDINKLIPQGWYRTSATASLYRASAQVGRLKEIIQKDREEGLSLFFRFLCVIVFAGVSVLVGVIVLFVQIIFLDRKVTPPEDLALVRAPAAYGFKSVYAVFIAWLAWQLCVSDWAQLSLHGAKLVQKDVFLAASGIALIYLISNVPALIFAYFLAMRPHAVGFLSGIKLKLRAGKLGPGKMILAGLLVWFAALPLVLVAQLVSMKLLGLKGSTNPIIALVMEAARSANLSAILVFYLTVGVLAPLCEESLFRGFLYSSLRRKLSILPSIAISAGLFAGVHLDGGAFPALFALGAVFAFAYEKTKSTLPGMIAHGLWNSGTFSFVLLLFGN
jgi:membrane protease YdiL (CAAX protease family)